MEITECEALAGCPFFNDKMQKMPSTADVYKKRYCLGDKTACARYMVKMEAGKENIPSDLFPNQVKRAREIISGLQT